MLITCLERNINILIIVLVLLGKEEAYKTYIITLSRQYNSNILLILVFRS